MPGWHEIFFGPKVDTRPRYQAKRNRPRIHVLGDWRGGQVWAVDGDITTIRLLAEQSYVRDKIVATSLVPDPTIGNAVVCRITGNDPDNSVIVEVRGSCFAGGGPVDQAVAVAAGEFWPGCIGEAEGWEPFYVD